MVQLVYYNIISSKSFKAELQYLCTVRSVAVLTIVICEANEGLNVIGIYIV